MNIFLSLKRKFDIYSYKYIQKYKSDVSICRLKIVDKNNTNFNTFIINSIRLNLISHEKGFNMLKNMNEIDNIRFYAYMLLSNNKENYKYVTKEKLDYPIIGGLLFSEDVLNFGIIKKLFITMSLEPENILFSYLCKCILGACTNNNPNICLIKYTNIFTKILNSDFRKHFKNTCSQIACIRGKYSLAKSYSNILIQEPYIENNMCLQHIKLLLLFSNVICVFKTYKNKHIMKYLRTRYVLAFDNTAENNDNKIAYVFTSS